MASRGKVCYHLFLFGGLLPKLDQDTNVKQYDQQSWQGVRHGEAPPDHEFTLSYLTISLMEKVVVKVEQCYKRIF